MAEENPGKPQLGDHLMKSVRPVIAPNGVPYLQMRSVRSRSKSGKENEVMKERNKYCVCVCVCVCAFRGGYFFNKTVGGVKTPSVFPVIS